MNALATGDKVSIVPSHPTLGLDYFMKLIGHVHSVEREDGSGYSFNVGVYVNNYTDLKTVYMRFSA